MHLLNFKQSAKGVKASVLLEMCFQTVVGCLTLFCFCCATALVCAAKLWI